VNPQKPAEGESGLKKPGNETIEKEREEPVSEGGRERRRFRRYRMPMPVWISYGQNYREVDSGQVQDFSKAGLFLLTEGGEGLDVGDVVRVDATFTVRGEARVVRVEEREDAMGIALEFIRGLALDI